MLAIQHSTDATKPEKKKKRESKREKVTWGEGRDTSNYVIM